MGIRVAPNVANVYMGRLEDKFEYQTEWANWPIFHAGAAVFNFGTFK